MMKKMIKRIMMCTLALGMGAALALVVGCKSGRNKVALWHQSVGETDPSGPILKRLVAEWNAAHPEYQIVEDGVSGEQYKTKINAALQANEAPEIAYLYGGSFMWPYLKANKFLEISAYASKDALSRILPGSLSQVTYDGKIYTLPCYTHIASLYCNTELFNKAGAKLPKTYAELLDAVAKLNAAGITPAVLGEKDRWPGMYWYDIIAMRQAGVPACMEAMRNPALFASNPDFVEASRKMQELVDAGLFNSSMFSMSFDEMLGAFNNGQAAMLYQGNWVDSGIETSSATAGKVTVIPFPVFPDGKGTAADFYGGDVTPGYYINANTKNPKKAVEFLQFFNENLCRDGYLAGAGLPCWNTDGLDTSVLSKLDREVAASMSTGKAFLPWWDNILPADASETHKNLISELLAKRITPQQFCQSMAKVAPSEL